ncbi:YqcC family protein [Psychromonas sp. KJ10-10]|uniref:YqcC family protein n=1 Tax=Psychromonas sp. KJ10-10 TaxID=3391823 RepID=UPI0039B40C5E
MTSYEQQHRHRLFLLLTELEQALKSLDLWQLNRPTEQALASQMPFAIDTLSFPEWLQFIFIEKMSQILQLGLPLPQKMAITAMASEYFKVQLINSDMIIDVITRIDLHINETNKC